MDIGVNLGLMFELEFVVAQDQSLNVQWKEILKLANRKRKNSKVDMATSDCIHLVWAYTLDREVYS